MQIIAMQNICKSFPGTKAVDHVNFSLGEGEIISLLGENGAGKTTLMNILYGIHQPDEGEIFFRGERVQVKRPTDAIDLGICMVHQHFMLAPAFSILDNIIVGYEPKRGMFVDRRKALKEVQALIDRFGFQLNPCTKVSELSVGEQQRVEILKALYRNAKVLILDEPTAVLAPKEVDDLLKMLQSLRAGGTSIVIITHKLKETMTIADRIVVLRSGKLICDDVRPANTNESELARLMIGREINMDTRRPSKCAGDVALCVRNLSLTENGICKLRNISFSIRKGEILGVAGVEGNGQTQLLEALTGLTQRQTDQRRCVFIHSKRVCACAGRPNDHGAYAESAADGQCDLGPSYTAVCFPQRIAAQAGDHCVYQPLHREIPSQNAQLLRSGAGAFRR